VPVVPVAVTGTHLVMPRDKHVQARTHPMVVAVGQPFTYRDVATGASEKENRELFARELEARIVGLCRENGLPLKTGAESKSPVASSAP
jgi:hypothetical protein